MAEFERPKVLILDDSVPQVMALTMSLEHCGLKVFGAHNTTDAARLVAEHPDLALAVVDLELEGGGDSNGFIRESLETRGIRFARRTMSPNRIPEDTRGEFVLSKATMDLHDEVDAIVKAVGLPNLDTLG